MIMAQGLFYFLLNKYLHVTFLFGIIKQITHGSEGDGTHHHPHCYVLFIYYLAGIDY